MLDCCKPLADVKKEGINLDQVKQWFLWETLTSLFYFERSACLAQKMNCLIACHGVPSCHVLQHDCRGACLQVYVCSSRQTALPDAMEPTAIWSATQTSRKQISEQMLSSTAGRLRSISLSLTPEAPSSKLVRSSKQIDLYSNQSDDCIVEPAIWSRGFLGDFASPLLRARYFQILFSHSIA